MYNLCVAHRDRDKRGSEREETRHVRTEEPMYKAVADNRTLSSFYKHRMNVNCSMKVTPTNRVIGFIEASFYRFDKCVCVFVCVVLDVL